MGDQRAKNRFRTTADNHWMSRAREHSSGMHNAPRQSPDVSARGCPHHAHVVGTGDRGPCAMRSNASWAMVTWVDRQTRMTGKITFRQLSWRAVNRCQRNLVTITTCLFPSPFFTLLHLMYHLNKAFVLTGCKCCCVQR